MLFKVKIYAALIINAYKNK